MCAKLYWNQFLKYIMRDPKARLLITGFSDLWIFCFCGTFVVSGTYLYGLLLVFCLGIVQTPKHLKIKFNRKNLFGNSHALLQL